MSSLMSLGHLAMVEAMGVASMFVAGFDISGTDGAVYQSPELDYSTLSHVSKPKIKGTRGMEVGIKARSGYEAVEWHFDM